MVGDPRQPFNWTLHVSNTEVISGGDTGCYDSKRCKYINIQSTQVSYFFIKGKMNVINFIREQNKTTEDQRQCHRRVGTGRVQRVISLASNPSCLVCSLLG